MRIKKAHLYCVLALFFSRDLAAVVPDPPTLAATAWILAEASSGRILAEKNSDLRLPPASLTKIMTSYVAAAEIAKGSVSEDDMALISEKAWRTKGSRTFLDPGSRVLFSDLLRGMIVQSGNDASVAIAEHVAGDEAVFVDAMNQYAAELGLRNSQFLNATGLPIEGHFSTAGDIHLLSQRLILDFPDHYQLYKERQFTYGEDYKTGEPITQRNRNRLLWDDPSVDGIKTGHTEEAGYCVAISAQQDGMRLIAVVMGTDSRAARFVESAKLLKYGFRYFETKEVFRKSQTVRKVRVWGSPVETVSLGVAEQLVLTLGRGELESIETLWLPDPERKTLWAPLVKGERLGMVRVSNEDGVLREIPAIILEDVPAASGFKRFTDSLRLFFGAQ